MRQREHVLVQLDDAIRSLVDADAITDAAATRLGEHLRVNRCVYASVEDDEETFVLTGNYLNGVQSIVGRYTFRQFGAECLRLMRAGVPYIVSDSDSDPRIAETDRGSYARTAMRAVICVPILKKGRLVAALAVPTSTPRTWRPAEVQLTTQIASGLRSGAIEVESCNESVEEERLVKRLR